MPASTHDNLPLSYDWDLGEQYKSGMDANLRLLGAVVQLAVESRTSDEPGTPTDGDRYIHNGGTWSVGTAGDVIARINGSWYVYKPDDGWIAKVKSETLWVEYQSASSSWVGFAGISAAQYGYIGALTSAPLEDDDLAVNGGTVPEANQDETITGTWTLTERSSDPSDPAEGEWVKWMSDGTGSGADGDIMAKITAGGVTKTVTLVDFSAN